MYGEIFMKKLFFFSAFFTSLFFSLSSCENISLDNQSDNSIVSTATIDQESSDSLFTSQTTLKSETTLSTQTSLIDDSTPENSVSETTVRKKADIQDLRNYYYTIPQLTNMDEILAQAKNSNLESYINYRSETGDGEDAWDAHIYIAPQSYSNNYGDFYEFSCDYIDVFVERRDRSQPFQLSKAQYIFYDSLYNVEYSAKGNLAGNHIQVCQGVYAVDPTATFSSLEEALEKAISLS